MTCQLQLIALCGQNSILRFSQAGLSLSMLEQSIELQTMPI